MAVRVLQGHCLDVLAGLEAQSAHVCITSPPYWKLRRYGCPPQTWPDGWVGELGQEDTPEDYVRHLVDVFRAVKRVLRDDGTLFCNLADSYWSDPGGQNGTTGTVSARAITANTQAGRQDRTSQKHDRLKPGDLVGTPWAFAFAMQEAGWLLRSAVTWIKTSPMPESIQGTRWERCKVKTKTGQVTPDGTKQSVHENKQTAGFNARYFDGEGVAEWADCPGCPRCAENEGLVLRRGSGRPTSATEMLFLFTKGMGSYFYDLEATKVAGSLNSHGGTPTSVGPKLGPVRGDGGVNTMGVPAGDVGRNAWNWMTFGGKGAQLKEAHYAAYPPQLPEFCVKAGTSAAGVCPNCGAPHARIVERRSLERYELPTDHEHYRPGRYPTKQGGEPGTDNGQRVSESTTLGWRPTCPAACHQGLPPRPAVVLDCFSGAGTTLLVADRMGRDAVGVELQPTYAAMSKRRVTNDAPLFAEVTLEGAAG